jgi:ubiquinone/menaquinone biosynthesis C-methylase UbiE
MATVEQNIQRWQTNYQWADAGEEWSSDWGGSDAQWFAALLPRIHPFLPAGTILEIAPGYGRWTHYLKNHCEELMIVDLAENCIRACQQRFAAESKISYHLNDGRSLAMIPDNSIDFVFSFDSLVHAEADVIEGYLNQLAKKLKPGGYGFIHHSNLGAYHQAFTLSEKLPQRVRRKLIEKRLMDFSHWRAPSMSAALFQSYCQQAGLQCLSQELVNWSTKRLIDCFSVFVNSKDSHKKPTEVIENPDFMKEAGRIRRLVESSGHAGR